jgi:hypothetical protein
LLIVADFGVLYRGKETAFNIGKSLVAQGMDRVIWLFLFSSSYMITCLRGVPLGRNA